jgi:hypothetical protein
MLRKYWVFAIVLLLGTVQNRALAYPEFISYGYSNCLTCHENGLGGGPLNDYGRALWSAEIASRVFAQSSLSDEDLGNRSGFLGSTPTPEWLKPFIKYRGMELQVSPSGGPNSRNLFLNMQEDIGFTSHFGADGRYTFSYTLGHVVRPEDYNTGKEGFEQFLSREYFFRTEFGKGWWVYTGLMEKVYGLRNVDHSSYQRTFQGFNESSANGFDGMAESLGVIVHKVTDKWEASVNAFFGNPTETSDKRETGLSGMAEFQVFERAVLGFSVLGSTSQAKNKQMAALHYKQGIAKGSSLLAEYGLIQDLASQNPSQQTTTGSYAFLETWVPITRGYNWTLTAERYNQQFNPSVPDQWRWIAGFLMFPAPRFEFRTDLVQSRKFQSQGSTDLSDQWSLWEQIHVSL